MSERLMRKIDSFSGEFRFLSNFHPCRIEFDGDIYESVEHAYQAAKFPNPVPRLVIRSMTPGKAKRFANINQKGWDRCWHEKKESVMRALVAQKFADAKLAQMLIDTGDAVLIEGNTWGDAFWGVCDGVGENRLGVILMEIRGSLQSIKV